MSSPTPLFYLIAGEPSGDMLGAALMRALRDRLGERVRFAGIGGEQMEAEGLTSRVPIRDLAIMGILEVLPSARRILRHVRETVADIQACRPVAVVTIDSSGFCFRVGERLKADARKSGIARPLLIHYVAPMVWAWREFRARNAARAADHLLTLLPFEPPYFEKVGLPATYVGHPVVEGAVSHGDAAGFRQRHGIDQTSRIILMLPGSRRGEVRRLLPPFRETAIRLAEDNPDLTIVIPTVRNVMEMVTQGVAEMPVRVICVTGTAEKFDAFAAADVALAASGTVTLELAAAGVPTVASYKVAPLTAWMLRRLVKLPSVTLVNILVGERVIPELLQEDCVAEVLAPALRKLLDDPQARERQKLAFDRALRMIGRGGPPPSVLAAETILKLALPPEQPGCQS